MSAPMRPWENGRLLQSSAPVLQGTMPGPSTSRYRTGAPSLPPRPNIMGMGPSNYMTSSYGRSAGMGYSPYNSYNSYGSYGGYGSMGGYGGGMFGGYGGMGGGMYGNSYGYGPESRFIQLAEESTRPAFQGIESLVRAFGSIAMMFDSTFFAVQSSFRAVLGVAENFGRIRTMFGQLWSSFALLRFLNWCYRKLLSMLGFNVAQDLGKAAWNEAIQQANTEGMEGIQQNASSWPIFMFLGMIVSAPYLISKLLPPVIDKRDPKNWNTPGKAARAVHTFQASGPQELSIFPGDKIMIAPMAVQQDMNLANSGWVFATSERGNGIIPLAYIQPHGGRKADTVRMKSAEPLAPTVEENGNEEEIRIMEEGFKGESSQREENGNK